ncbi:MAG: GTP-binding protein [archaeon]|nr:GTP-binding protein [archaeon]
MSSDYIFKYLTLGDFSVGKTTLTLRFSGETIPKNSMSTIGIDFKTKMVKLSNGKTVKLLLYDTAGQERFRKIAANYYNGTDCVFLVFDLTNSDTFKILSFWVEELSERINQSEGDFEIILIGNKSDLKEDRKVDKAEAEEMAKNLKMKYFEVSAMNGDGMKELINYSLSRVEAIIKARDKALEGETEDDNRISRLADVPQSQLKNNKKKVGCC